MTKLPQGLAKNVKFLSSLFVLLFALVSQSTTTSTTHAASVANNPPTTAVAKITPPTTTVSQNWSGYEATGPVGTFNRVQCRATVPTLASNGDVSEWCGLGGDPNGIPQGVGAVLVQAGVDSCLGPGCAGGNANVQHDYAWWEIADALVVQPVRFSQGIHTGDDMYFYMESDFKTSGFNRFYIQNITTKEAHTVIINKQGATKDRQITAINTIGSDNGPIPIASDSASVECILERPLDAISGTLAHLPDLDKPERISQCDGGVGTSSLMKPIGTFPNVNRIKMFNDPNSGRSQANNSARQGGQSPLVITDVSGLDQTVGHTFTVSNSNGEAIVQGTNVHTAPGESIKSRNETFLAHRETVPLY